MLKLFYLVLLLVKLAVDGVGDLDQGLNDALLHRQRLHRWLRLLHERLAKRYDRLENGIHQTQRALQTVPLEFFLWQVRLGQLF